MKKTLRMISVLLVLVLALSSFTFAETTDKPTATVKDGASQVTFNTTDYKSMDVTFNDADVASGEEYIIMVLLLDADGEYVLPTEDNPPLYLNQITATANGSVTFKTVYPSQFKNSIIMVSGTSTGLVEVATVTYPKSWEVLYGDVNGDEAVNPLDAIVILQAAAKITQLTDEQAKAADVDADGNITPLDAIYVLQAAASLIGTDQFPANQ